MRKRKESGPIDLLRGLSQEKSGRSDGRIKARGQLWNKKQESDERELGWGLGKSSSFLHQMRGIKVAAPSP